MIGHSKKGLHKVYDQHEPSDERREALELGRARLRLIVEPPPPGRCTTSTRAGGRARD